MVKIKEKCISLEQICQSGQCFRMSKKEDGSDKFFLVAFGKYLEMWQSDEYIYFDCSEKEYEEIWRHYFDIDKDYDLIIKSVDENDVYMLRATEYGNGIRILNQELWEMIISFIISQQNNIKRIRKCIGLLCERYGERAVLPNGYEYYSFPTPKALSELSIEELMECNLGYRAKYIKDTSQKINSGEFSLDHLKTLSYEDARKELLTLFGVGKKVADCICLFSLHCLDAFPIDTHINSVLANHYTQGFPFDRYRGYNGVMQQYIFYYDLMKPDED